MGAGKMLWRLATLVTSEVMCDNGRLMAYYRNAVSRLSGPRTYLVPHTLRCCHHQLGMVMHLGGRKVDLRESEASLVYTGILGQPALYNKILS